MDRMGSLQGETESMKSNYVTVTESMKTNK